MPTVADTGMAGLIVPRTPRAAGTARPIDLAYRDIDALGGWFDPNDREAAIRAACLHEVLAIMERHGAVDPDLAMPEPAKRRSAAA